MKIHKSKHPLQGNIYFVFLTLMTIAFPASNSIAGQLNGFVFHTGGGTLIIGENTIGHFITTDSDPCSPTTNWHNAGGQGGLHTDGTFTFTDLPNGSYYVMSFSYSSASNYITEYWAGPLSDSVRDCSAAVPAVISGGGAVNNIRFELDEGATISGTVYRADGTTPIIGESNLRVDIYSGNPCDYDYVNGWWANSSDGNYTLWGVAPGTYYLKTNSHDSDYHIVGEWWAESESIDDCLSAEPIVITGTESIIEKNFQLNYDGQISGVVYNERTGLPLTGQQNLKVIAFDKGSDPCSSPQDLGNVPVNSTNGTYSFEEVPADSYYLGVSFSNSTEITEWSSGTSSNSSCSNAQLVIVTDGLFVTGKDFHISSPSNNSWNLFLPAILNSSQKK